MRADGRAGENFGSRTAADADAFAGEGFRLWRPGAICLLKMRPYAISGTIQLTAFEL